MEDIGKCVECGMEYTGQSQHQLVDYKNEIVCRVCKRKFGEMTHEIIRDKTKTNICTLKYYFKLTNGATFTNPRTIYNPGELFISSSVNTININSDRTEGQFSATVSFIESYKKPFEYFAIYADMTVDGQYANLTTNYDVVYPDIQKPIISNIQLVGNEWTKSKPITVTGTENWTDTVSVKIENDRGRVVFEGGANVTNNNWSVSCTPEIEAGEETRIFTVTVTDSCENSTTQEFEVSKVDGRPPTVKSSDKVTDSQWAREKKFTFTAEDLGIGNVEIGFNDVADYSLAVKNGNNYSKEYKFVGDAYNPVQASVYFKDGLGNITTQVVTLEKIDNTAPTITNAILNNNVVHITAHDRHSMLGEGSGVVKYRYITSTEKLESSEITFDNSQEVNKNELFTISNINEVKYIYVIAEDLVGNKSESYEIEVPKITLTNSVSEEGANGKGEVLLDWTGYDITNKYFVIYRKQEDEEEWKTIVKIEDKLNSSTYIDILGNDVTKPDNVKNSIEKDIENNKIKLIPSSIDNGTKYTYYIESYDKNTGTLIAKSNIVSVD